MQSRYIAPFVLWSSLMTCHTALFAQTALQSCNSLNGLEVPSSTIALKTSGAAVQSATLVAATEPGNKSGEYCAVRGIVKRIDPAAPDMQFQINLPSNWNGKALQMGGGGFNGALVTATGLPPRANPTDASPLARGYVTLGGDGGHQETKGALNARNLMNDEVLRNFGHESVKKVHDVAIYLMERQYKAKLNRFYFIGNSQGGHEALDAASRYSADYDGVVSFFPAINPALFHLDLLEVGRAFYANGGKSFVNSEKMKLLADTAIKSCDKLDGAVDGLISDVAACNKVFDMEAVRKTLRCKDGLDTGNMCLSDLQIQAIEFVNSVWRPGFSIGGATEHLRWPVLEGALLRIGSVSQPSDPLSGKEGIQYTVGTQMSKYILARDPNLDPMKFRISEYKDRIEAVSSLVDVYNVNLEPFRAKGGKILLLHGTVDDLISPYNTLAYYKKQLAQFGPEKLDAFLYFSLVPGLGHGNGPFSAAFDAVSALERWVEQGAAPSNLIAVDTNPETLGRTRPLCRYPQIVKFNGKSGASLTDAANFICQMPSPS
jgi:hypothetical protein